MKFLLTLLFSFLVFFQVSAQYINGSSTAQVGECTSYALGSWGNTCVTIEWSVLGGTITGSSENTPTIEVCWTTSGTHTISATDGCGRTESIPVQVCPTISITPSTTTACIGQTVTLTAPTGFDYYTWTGATGNGNTASFTPSSRVSHPISVEGRIGTCTVTSSLTLAVQPAPTISPSVTIQAGQSTQLCASGGTSYLWNNGSRNSCINVSPRETTPYSVQITNACGTTTLSTNVTVRLSITAPTSVCLGQPIVATASGGLPQYNFFRNNIPITSQNGTSVTFTPTTTGNVVIRVTDATGASATASILVTNIPTSVTPPITIQSGQFTQLCATGGTNDMSYFWQPGGLRTRCITVNPSVTTPYSVQITNACGTTTLFTSVNVNTVAPLSISAGGNTILACKVLFINKL